MWCQQVFYSSKYGFRCIEDEDERLDGHRRRWKRSQNFRDWSQRFWITIALFKASGVLIIRIVAFFGLMVGNNSCNSGYKVKSGQKVENVPDVKFMAL